MFREQELEQRYPSIPWKEPIKLGSLKEGSITLFGCRYCIAMRGLLHSTMASHPKTHVEFKEHLKKVHDVEISLGDSSSTN